MSVELPGRRVAGRTDGRDRLSSNVLSSWGGQIVVVIAGFILPRLINTHLGQELLGVWDFAWSLVSHLGLVQMGLTSSVNRYVALYRAQEDLAGVNRVASTASALLSVAGILVLALALLCALGIDIFLRESLVLHCRDAQWLIILLAAGSAIHVATATYGGILTGCHRWDIHNAVYAGTCLLQLVGMIAVLLMGQGLVAVAIVNLVAETLGRTVRIVLAHKQIKDLRVRWKSADLKTARELFHFGSKGFVPDLGQILQNQTIGLLLVSALGPAALAVYCRPRSLVIHVRTFIQKFAMVLTPTVGSLHGAGNSKAISDLTLKSCRLGAYLAVPILLFISLMGGELLELWMGKNFRNPALPAVLALGSLTYFTYLPLYSVLTGLNAHGRPGIANLLGSVCSIGLAYITLYVFNFGLIGVAVSVALPMTTVNGIYMPVWAARNLGIDLRQLVITVWKAPILCAFPFATALVISKLAFPHSAILALISAVLLGGSVLGVIYWRKVVPYKFKARIGTRLGFAGNRA